MKPHASVENSCRMCGMERLRRSRLEVSLRLLGSSKKSRAVTLVEIVVVVAILLILVTVIGLVIGPRAKEGGIGRRITSDLKQVVVAINIYMADNDDRLPKGYSDLPSTTPHYYPNWPKHAIYGITSNGGYFYTYPGHTQERVARYPFAMKFDGTKHPIVVASFFAPRPKFTVPCMDRWRGGPRILINCQLDWILSGFLDGSVRWTKQRDEWRRESSYWNMNP